MNDKLYEQLAKDNPDLFENKEFELSVGDGWYNIIASLMSIITHDVTQSTHRLRYERANGNDVDRIAAIEAIRNDAIADLPSIDQIKEKFGGLRFYYTGGLKEKRQYIDGAIDMAESIADRTCESCGRFGERRPGAWIRTLCDLHYAESESRLHIGKSGRIPPKILDED